MRWVVDGLGIVAGLVAAAGLVQFFVGYGAIDRRIRGPFSHWMTFSGFLLQCDLLLIARLVAGPRPAPPPAGAPSGGGRWCTGGGRSLAAINLALLGSLTRSAWVAVVAALVLLALLRAPRLLLAFAPAAVVFALLAPVQVLARAVSIVDLRDPSNYDRLCMTEAGLRMVAERPLFGIGPGQVKLRYALYRPPRGTATGSLTSTTPSSNWPPSGGCRRSPPTWR